MNNEQHHNDILKEIKSGSISAHSETYFIAKKAALFAGLIATGLITLFLGSFIIYALRANGAWFAPAFGAEGFRALLGGIPWLFVAALLLFLLLLNIILRQYRLGYRRPVLYTIATAGVLLVIFSLALARLHVHEQMEQLAENRQLPFVRTIYLSQRQPLRADLILGMIIRLKASGFDMACANNQVYDVLIGPTTRLPYDDEFYVNDVVLVLGQRHGQQIDARGVRKVPQNQQPYYKFEHYEP